VIKKSQSIKTLLKRYKNEWLLIDLDKIDERTLQPKTGRLVAHSPRKEDLSERVISHKGRLLRVFSGPLLPAGFQAAF
jgi:hypothetical protein